MPPLIDEDIASGLIESVPSSGAGEIPMPDWFAAPTCRCDRAMQLTLIAQRSDATQVRTYKCTVCDHQMRLTVWAN